MRRPPLVSSPLRWPIGVLALTALTLTARCGGGGAPAEPPPPVFRERQVLTSMSVSLTPASVPAGQSATAALAALDQHGQPMTVGATGWESSRIDVATISAAGVVTALATGTTIISARVGSVEGKSSFVVTPPPQPPLVASVTVSPTSTLLEVGKTRQLFATPKDFAGAPLPDRAVLWRSSAPEIATVSANGLVTARASGTALIEATSDGTVGGTGVVVTGLLDPDVEVTVALPIPGTVVGDTVTVVATARSPATVSSVVAFVGGRQTALTFGPIGSGRGSGWSGLVDLATLATGPYELVVTATDSRDHRGAASLAIDRNPTVAGGTRGGQTGNK